MSPSDFGVPQNFHASHSKLRHSNKSYTAAQVIKFRQLFTSSMHNWHPTFRNELFSVKVFEHAKITTYCE